jgi:hypothetical protein
MWTFLTPWRLFPLTGNSDVTRGKGCRRSAHDAEERGQGILDAEQVCSSANCKPATASGLQEDSSKECFHESFAREHANNFWLAIPHGSPDHGG